MGPVLMLVSSLDLIRRIYRFQYSPRTILKAICAGVGFGSGTETMPLHIYNYLSSSQRVTQRLCGVQWKHSKADTIKGPSLHAQHMQTSVI